MFQVINEKTNEVLFESEDNLDCLNYIYDYYSPEHEDFEHVQIKEVE